MEKTRRRRRRRPWGRVLLFLIFFFAACYAAVHCALRPPEQKPLPPQQSGAPTAEVVPGVTQPEDTQEPSAHMERKPNFYTILLSGADNGNGGCDTNILLAVDAEAHTMYGVSIPRDSKAVIRGKSYKINAAYNIGGMELLAETVSEQLGIPVDYTVLVDLQGFEDVVNAIGGVDFYIPVDMDYDDQLQDLSIHFSQGMRHLNGEEALKVVRFRHNNDGTGYGTEDVGRMQTQQKFLKAVASQTLSLSNWNKVDDLIRIFSQSVTTDLTAGNLAWLAKEAVNVGTDGLEFSTLPGDWHKPYIYLRADEVLEVVNQHLNPYTEDRTAEDLNIPLR